MLDALIGNTDRHHENWAAVEMPAVPGEAPTRYLAPTFDHASSLGRNEPLGRIIQRLGTRDQGFTVEAYSTRTRSAFYLDAGDKHPLSPIEVFETAIRICGGGVTMWCSKLDSLSDDVVLAILDEIPRDRIAAEVVQFVARMIAFNRHRLIELCQKL
jgi:hypothetical protein